jgi:hypothetical protein
MLAMILRSRSPAFSSRVEDLPKPEDLREKFNGYERHGVRKYWTVDPAGEWFCIYRPRLDASGEARYDERDAQGMGQGLLEGGFPFFGAFAVEPQRIFAELD